MIRLGEREQASEDHVTLELLSLGQREVCHITAYSSTPVNICYTNYQ